MSGRVRGWPVTMSPLCRGGRLGLDLVQQARGLAALDAGDVVLVFEQHAQRVVDRLRASAPAHPIASALRPSRSSRRCPGNLNRSIVRSFCTKPTTSRDEMLAGARRLAPQDLQLARRARVIDPVIKAAPLQRVVDFARAVRGDDDDRRRGRADRADLGDRHLEIGKQLQKIGLERLVGAVELVDQQDRRAGDVRLQRLQQRPLDQKAVGEDRALDFAAVFLGRLRRGGSRSSAARNPIRRPPRRRRAPHSIAAGSAGAATPSPAPWRSRSCRPRPRLRGTAAASGAARGAPPSPGCGRRHSRRCPASPACRRPRRGEWRLTQRPSKPSDQQKPAPARGLACGYVMPRRPGRHRAKTQGGGDHAVIARGQSADGSTNRTLRWNASTGSRSTRRKVTARRRNRTTTWSTRNKHYRSGKSCHGRTFPLFDRRRRTRRRAR